MERDILEVGDTVDIFESKLPRAYYYTVKPAQAMSGNYKASERIKSTVGKVVGKNSDGASWILDIEFDE